MKQYLPINMLITKFEKETSRIYLSHSNDQAQKALEIFDSESLNDQSKKIMLQRVIDSKRSEISLYQYLSKFHKDIDYISQIKDVVEEPEAAKANQVN